MAQKTDYTNNSQQRILRVVLAMFGHEIEGVLPGQLAKMVEVSPSEVTRDLSNLQLAGWVETLPDGKSFRITPMIGQKAIAILHGIERAADSVAQIRNRYTRVN